MWAGQMVRQNPFVKAKLLGAAALLAAAFLSACSGGSSLAPQTAALQPPAPAPSNQTPLAAGLPAVGSLRQKTRQTSDLLSDPNLHVPPQSAFLISGGVNWGTGESAIFESQLEQ